MSDSTKLFIALGALAAVYMCKSEGFIEFPGFAGISQKKDITLLNTDGPDQYGDLQETSVAITPSQLQEAVMAAQKFIKAKTGICAYAIYTPYARIFNGPEGKMYMKIRFMFTATQGFPYGFLIDVVYGDGKILQTNTQPVPKTSDNEGIAPFMADDAHVFLPFEEIERANIVKVD